MSTGNTSSGGWASRTARKKISVISIAVDAPQDIISALSGKIGRLPGVSAKTAYSNVVTKQEEAP